MVVGLEKPAGVDAVVLKEGAEIQIVRPLPVQLLQKGVGAGVAALRQGGGQQLHPPLELLGGTQVEVGDAQLLQLPGKRRGIGGIFRGLGAHPHVGAHVHKVQRPVGQLGHRVLAHRVLHDPPAGQTLDAPVELDEPVLPIQILVDGALRPVHKGHHVPLPDEALEQGLKLSLPAEEGGEQQDKARRHRQQEHHSGDGIASSHGSHSFRN